MARHRLPIVSDQYASVFGAPIQHVRIAYASESRCYRCLEVDFGLLPYRRQQIDFIQIRICLKSYFHGLTKLCHPPTSISQFLIEHRILVASRIAQRLELLTGALKIGIYFRFIGKIVRERTVNLLQR